MDRTLEPGWVLKPGSIGRDPLSTIYDPRWDNSLRVGGRQQRVSQGIHSMSLEKEHKQHVKMAHKTAPASDFRGANWERVDSANQIYDLSEHVSLEFQDIFTEPESYYKRGNKFSEMFGDRIQRSAFSSVFTYVQLGLYYVLSMIIGLFLSLAWSVVFAVSNVAIVWVVHPTWKIIFMWLRPIAVMWRTVIRIILEPIFASIGLTFSYFRGKFWTEHTSPTYRDAAANVAGNDARHYEGIEGLERL